MNLSSVINVEIGSTWYEAVLKEEEQKEYFIKLVARLNQPQSTSIFPPRELILIGLFSVRLMRLRSLF